MPDLVENCLLGETREALSIATGAELRAAALTMVRQGRSSLLIFSRDLDPPIYDTPSFAEAVAHLARSAARGRVHILVQRVDALARAGHRLLELSRRLSSYVHLREVPKSFASFNEAFLVVDQAGLIHRPHADRYAALAHFAAPYEARQFTKLFGEAWDHSTVPMALKRLHL